MKVLFSPDVRLYFQDLIEILLEKEYFGLEESAVKYVRSLFFAISDHLPTTSKRKAPQYFDRYGIDMYYAVFKKNKNTSWYIFFNQYMKKRGKLFILSGISAITM